MAEMDFGRQLKPVHIHVIGGDAEDRIHWANKINGWLQHQPCVTLTSRQPTLEIIAIHPDANND